MSELMRRRFAVSTAILLSAFALRLVAVEARPLWYDDAFSVFLAERGPAAIAEGTAGDTMPPGYYLLLFGWMRAVGQTPTAMRMLSVGLSMVSIALVYAIAKRGLGERAAEWATLLTALMPFQLYHAQELRMYTLMGLGALVYLLGVTELEMRERGGGGIRGTRANAGRASWRALGWIAAGTAIALYAHNLAFATLVAGNVYFLLGRAWRAQARLIAGQVAGVVFFTPWLWYVPTQLEKIQRAFWTQLPGAAEVVQMLMLFTTYLPLPPALLAPALFVTILVLILAVWQLSKLARRQELPALGLLAVLAVAPPVVLFVLSYAIRPVFVPRGVIGSALAYWILLGAAAASAPRRVQVGVLVAALVMAGVILPFYYSAYGEWRRAPFAEADAFLREQWRAGDLILHDNKLAFFPMHLYDRSLPQVFLADPPQSDNDTLAPASQTAMGLYPTDFDAAVAGRGRVWFVIYQTAIDEAQSAGVPHGNIARLDGKFQQTQVTTYGDLRILLYTARQ